MNGTVKKIYEDTYVIVEEGLAGLVNCYLLIGKEKALLIDSGYGIIDLKSIVSEITNKEVICALTHGHMDHANGSYQFENTYMHYGDKEIFNVHCSADFIHKNWVNGLNFKKPQDEVNSKEFFQKLDKVKEAKFKMPRRLQDIEFFDLGDRKVNFINTPGHTLGSVCYYDVKYNTLFTGDNITSRPWLFLDESVEVEKYKKGLETVQALIDEKNICDLYPAHTRRIFKSSNVEDLIKCCDMSMDESNQGRRFEFRVGGGTFYNQGKCMLFTK